jgi:hypothetical protein
MLPLSNNLYRIDHRYLELMQQIEEAEGEITPEIEQALSITQEQLQVAAINIAQVIKSFEYNEAVLKEEIQRLITLKQKAAKSKELLKNRLSESMQYFGIEKIESPTIKLSFRKSKAIEIIDEMEIPAAYFNQAPPVPDKAAIKEAIERGEEIQGAELVERLNLQIK